MEKLLNIQEINVREASHQEYQALRKLMDVLSKERQPDDPVVPLEETINQMKNLPSFVNLKMWCVWDENHENMLAQGNVGLIYTDDNRHLSHFDIIVHPASRRLGIGKQLLKLIAEAALADNRSSLLTDTNDRIPAGEAFMQQIDAKRGLEGHVNQLRIDELDQNLIRNWLERGSNNEDEFEIGIWEGEYPEEKLDEIVQLIDLTNQQPLGDLAIEEMHFTAEQLREMEKMDAARGNQRFTFYLLEKATGKFAGYTETVWNANRPEILRQDMTGVFPQYRGKGLGRWLKAAMLDRMLIIHPEIKFVRTQNADSNAAMLRINNELGFKPYMTSILWQMEISQVLDYLKKQSSKEG
ncbi:MAG TPA: GNAT family N-acetyltransferase [Anaerolineaceae bacterium]|nr:GNAT family N-acetyltransferase [Anaerolineaceae bacterium]